MTDEERQLYIDYKELFGSGRGRKVLADLDFQCRYKRDIFNSQSERLTCFWLGGHAIAKYIHEMIDKNLDEVKQKEAVHETNL